MKQAIIVPMGTGMSLGLALRGCLVHDKINLLEKPLVLMPRIDHKSPVKGIEYIGAQVQTVPCHYGKNPMSEEGVYSTIEEIESLYHKNKAQISAIISTTTFFAPRIPDDIKAIAKFAKQNNLIHIVNNAYGLQSPEICKIIRGAIDAGRVDAIVQSTDKNLLTPVGGAIILSPDKEIVEAISQVYAGRAGAGPILHVLVSLLALGKMGYRQLIGQQQNARKILQEDMGRLAAELKEHCINSNNPVSCAMTLKNLTPAQVDALGGFLYNLRVTGPRIIIPSKSTYGTCTEEIQFPYIVMNAAIGVEDAHVEIAIDRLRTAIAQITRKN